MKVTRLKSGGFMSSGTDAGDLAILRKAKNIDDGSGMKAGGPVKAKLKKVSSMLRKASKAQLIQAKLALKSYEQEKAAIEKAHAKEVEDMKKAQATYNKALAHIDQQFSRKTDSVNSKKEKQVRDMIKKAKKDPDEIDRILEQELGIKKYG